MPKYMVTADVAASVWQEVEAFNSEEAIDKAMASGDWKESDPNQPDSSSDYSAELIEG